MRLPRPLMLAATLAIAACGARAPGSPSALPSDSHVMNLADIQEARQQALSNVYDMVMRYHPNWMRSYNGVAVQAWMDQQRLGDVTELRRIPLTAVVLVRVLSASEAQGELGMNNRGGAIQVVTR